jgi:hypothetical protein
MKSAKWIGTGEAARILMMNKNVLRATYYHKGVVCGLKPEKIDGVLRWNRPNVIKVSIQRQADCVAMMRTLEGIAEWLGQERIDTDDERVEMVYEILKELGGRY